MNIDKILSEIRKQYEKYYLSHFGGFFSPHDFLTLIKEVNSFAGKRDHAVRFLELNWAAVEKKVLEMN